jgi:hypothetical protein
MASDSADQALSPDVTNFVICGKHRASAIQCTVLGLEPLKRKKMVQSFGDAFATARVEGVFMGRGSAQKNRVKGPTYQMN